MNSQITTAHALDDYLSSVSGTAFSWGDFNCCHYVSAWVALMEGNGDPMTGLPRTDSLISARRLIAKLDSLPEATTKALSRQPISPLLAQTGDIVYVSNQEGDGFVGLGICVGRRIAMLTDGSTLAALPMSAATMAWRLERAPS